MGIDLAWAQLEGRACAWLKVLCWLESSVHCLPWPSGPHPQLWLVFMGPQPLNPPPAQRAPPQLWLVLMDPSPFTLAFSIFPPRFPTTARAVTSPLTTDYCFYSAASSRWTERPVLQGSCVTRSQERVAQDRCQTPAVPSTSAVSNLTGGAQRHRLALAAPGPAAVQTQTCVLDLSDSK